MVNNNKFHVNKHQILINDVIINHVETFVIDFLILLSLYKVFMFK